MEKKHVAALGVHDGLTNCCVIMATTVKEIEQLMLVSESNTTPVSSSPFMSFQNISTSSFSHVPSNRECHRNGRMVQTNGGPDPGNRRFPGVNSCP